MATQGLEVLGVGVAATAIEVARSKAVAHGVNVGFLLHDALQLGRLGQVFQAVLDCGLFHTFDDRERRRYVESLAAVTARGGLIHLLCFNDTTPGNGGPRHVSQAEIRSSFSNGWRVVRIDSDRYETKFDNRGSPAWLARIERL
ncbi:cyclopropane fatty-acyl-phospholipid synthase-like methyltransferase [Microlunatus parietis]|uniref:Cyclopropane fatty-acyl-phospholipid synthase-like methyltransferase n=1 Tax=Microlunatus parietis TaxID=682979 RepID=A0A7Y9I274_9ACTN|nr:cyclopropane fatty-acyl-phospholipid synthase-like methyltransferase [Microlunatus parietis]